VCVRRRIADCAPCAPLRPSSAETSGKDQQRHRQGVNGHHLVRPISKFLPCRHMWFHPAYRKQEAVDEFSWAFLRRCWCKDQALLSKGAED